MFSVFAIGAYFDVDQRLHSVGAEEYYCLARSALGFDLGTTQVSIQAYVSGVRIRRTHLRLRWCSCTLRNTSITVIVNPQSWTYHGCT